MTLRDCRFLADENLHSAVIAHLRNQGVDVTSVREQGWSGTTDRELLHRAHADDRVILTHDSDFGLLAIRQGEPVYGILYLRPGHIKPEQTVTTLQTLFDQSLSVTPPFLVVAQKNGENLTIRMKSLLKQDREGDGSTAGSS